MKEKNDKMPDPKELEKEISEFLTKKFGDSVKVISPIVLPQEAVQSKSRSTTNQKKVLKFDLKPQELIAYLDQYIVKQDTAKAVLATKICTHFNRVKRHQTSSESVGDMVGIVKNNVLMIGPTGVGKTYLIRLIANLIGVPFVKGDATKFSETGYVGGDVEDLIRDLVREADDDIELAQHGIVYIDEIDKIASSRNLMGADISRTGVQRALLKPLEETEVEMKVPHDPISMMQEIERFKKTGNRDKRVVNTGNILFIMSGAFNDLPEIIKKRLTSQPIGFGAQIASTQEDADILKHVKAEDLMAYGFESEFIGRLPVRAIFERLTEKDLLTILKNPNNPIILGKKLDFAAYDIDIKFEEAALGRLAAKASLENTGARGLASAVEAALLEAEKCLPSTDIKKFPVTAELIDKPEPVTRELISAAKGPECNAVFERLISEEMSFIKSYLEANQESLNKKHGMIITPTRMNIAKKYYSKHVMDVNRVLIKIKSLYEDIKKFELHFFKNHDINIVLEEDAIDYIIEKIVVEDIIPDDFYDKLSMDFEHGLKLIREKTEKNRFFISREALLSPEAYISTLLKEKLSNKQAPDTVDNI
jgi:ATP-dependent Clp protease ATP-binding subunit ClpX